MTPPMTPREKVSSLKTNDPTNPAHRLADDLQKGRYASLEARDDMATVLLERETLLAEIAALQTRSTEAERKLAEAVGLLQEILPPVLCGESWGLPDSEISHQRMSFGWINKTRAFLSKEAERG